MRGNPIPLKEFGGHYPSFNDGQIPDNSFKELRNLFITPNKTIRTRYGLRRRPTTNANNGQFTTARMFGIYHSTFGDYFMVRHSAGVDYFTSSYAFSHLTNDTHSLFLETNQKGYLFDISSTLATITGSGVYTVTPVTTVKANLGVVFKNRMFVCNNLVTTVAQSQLRYSDIFDLNAPDTVAGWTGTGAGTIDFGSADNDFITSIVLLNDTMFVFKRFSTWVCYVEGSPPWTVRKIHPSIGCIGKDTAVVIGGLIYFRSAVGVYRTDGTTFELISAQNKEIFDNSPSFTQTACNNRSAIWFNDLYILNDYMTGGFNYNNRLEVYSLEADAWSYWDTGVGNISTMLVNPAESPPRFYVYEYVFDSPVGYLHDYSELNGWGDGLGGVTPVTAEIKSKYYDFDKPSDYKMIREVDVDMTVATGFDFNMSMTQYNEKASSGLYAQPVANPGGSQSTRKLYRWRGPFRCRAHKFDLSWTADQDVEINEIVWDMGSVGRVGKAR